MTSLRVFILGRGRVGARLAAQIAAARGPLARQRGVALDLAGVAGRQGGAALVARAIRAGGPRLLVDATDAFGMAAVHARALAAGVHVVTCNKKPLGGPQRDWDRIARTARATGAAALHEVTVGAGIPVLRTIRDLRESGDRIESVEGCVSGTLNFLCAALEAGRRFSAALGEARRLGYTEPDPREDLAGGDAARKALILARVSGWRLEPDAMRTAPFVAFDGGGDVRAFLAAARGLDAPLGRRFSAAARRGRRLRYVARVVAPPAPRAGGAPARRRKGHGTGAARVSVGLREVPADGPLGRLTGPENVFVVRTRRYHRHPLVLSGPGAGPEVTAAGALGDILEVARSLALGPASKPARSGASKPARRRAPRRRR